MEDLEAADVVVVMMMAGLTGGSKVFDEGGL